MLFCVQRKAYAKINLQLNITGKREDGYHTLSTVMHKTGLYDTVTVRRIESGWGVKCRSPEVPNDESNIVFPAGVMFFAMLAVKQGRLSMNDLTAGFLQSDAFDFTKIAPPYEIIIDKKIPVQAGLGGGSSDAAATLLALNELIAEDGAPPFDERDLLFIAKAIGADVPFCLHANMKDGGFSARCEGIGEIIEPISVSLPDFLVLAKGKEGVSTAAAYKRFDENPPAQRNEPFYNVFETLTDNEETKLLRETFKSFGAEEISLTGSGSCMYGFFENKKAAEACRQFLNKRNFWAVIA
ncbi:MAG: 4-(cytidine 5'-diphospho)-2-C-methyl-D-erythritol kinase [Ruminococcus sp.]|jgi:4-diphosphocytidyl-2-C-methyl-D-erythritol kinase|nr:4-(cytidine 5'-diphospho)-2-C-methyl-D-erythritol kinase [Ruminococcus sp.]